MAESAKQSKSEEVSKQKKDRVETYEATRPDGTTVTVTHNIETGETSVS